MLKRILIGITFLILPIIALSGCSYKELDDKIQGGIRAKEQGIDGYTSEGRAYIEVSMPPEDNIEYKGIGETFSGFIEYTSDGEVDTKGNEGLAYTLNSVKVYNSILDSGVDLYGCQTENQDMRKNNAFILIDITATYTVPLGSSDEIVGDAAEFSGNYLTDNRNDNFGDRKTDGKIEPHLSYFSNRPAKDNKTLDYQQDFFCFNIKGGESLNFQIGILCAEEFIETKNVYLGLNEFSSGATVDCPRKLFVLFPESEGCEK